MGCQMNKCVDLFTLLGPVNLVLEKTPDKTEGRCAGRIAQR